MTGKTPKRIGLAGSVAILAGQLLINPMAIAQSSVLEEGKALAFERSKGNCLACHMIQGGTAPGNIAPPLIAMKGRYPDKEKLRQQIFDATVTNPESAMPPFGQNEILSKAELDKLVDFIWTL